MRTRKYVKLYLLLLIIGLFLIACGGQPAEQEPISMDSEPLNSEAMDDGFADDTEPQLQHEIAMREKLDEAVMTKFGYDQVRVSRSVEKNSFSLKYELQDFPDGSEMYLRMEELFEECFDMYLFGEHTTLSSWYEWNDEDPESMSVMFEFEGSDYYWMVSLEGNFLVFQYL